MKLIRRASAWCLKLFPRGLPRAVAACGLLFLAPASGMAQDAGDQVFRGVLSDGVTNYSIRVPSNWNGTLLVNLDYNDTSATSRWLLEHGYALSGTVRGPAGWDLTRAAEGLIETMDRFNVLVEQPTRVVVWGTSRGGIVARTALQLFPDRFDGGAPMCGGGAGSIPMWNVKLGAAFALQTLIAPELGINLELTGITSVAAESAKINQIMQHAQSTPAGRARVALAAAFTRIPTWTSASQPEPAPDDWATRQANQAANMSLALGLQFQAFMEGLAGGSFLWNHDVDYRVLLNRSGYADLVRELYAQAGLDLNEDLRALERAPRVFADPAAVAFIERNNITWNGRIRQPVLTVLTTGDPAGPVSDEDVYADVVRYQGNARLLRNTFVHRGGHCSFTASEQLAILTTLFDRLDSGVWKDTATASALNARAAELDAESPLNLGTPAFIQMNTPQHLLPWDVRDWGTYGVGPRRHDAGGANSRSE